MSLLKCALNPLDQNYITALCRSGLVVTYDHRKLSTPVIVFDDRVLQKAQETTNDIEPPKKRRKIEPKQNTE
jgi:hypothetical protein